MADEEQVGEIGGRSVFYDGVPEGTLSIVDTPNGWSKKFVEWVEGDTAYVSVVFSWDLHAAFQRCVWLKQMGYKVRAGGPAVTLNPDYLADVAEIGGEVNALPHHNPNATFTSRGCVRQCKFCAVHRIEGSLVELEDWEPKPIVCDNNLLACSKKHFDRVIDRLKPLHNIDFNQGLDARLLTPYHASRLAELDCTVRLAYDHPSQESSFRKSFELLRHEGIPKSRMSCYVLIGFNDTPEDALYRLQVVRSMGIFPFPMRYQPLGAIKRNSYIASGWTNRELVRYMRYWSNLRHTAAVPFEDFR